MSEHPIFAPYLQENKGKTVMEAPINELSEGLAQLKYDPEHNTFLEVAQSYKEEGLTLFKLKKYRKSIVSFTEAIKQKFLDDLLRAQLHNNRGAAHYFLGNYRSAIKDSEEAYALKSDYMKPIQRAVQCAVSLKSGDEVLTWCDRGLKSEPTSEFFIKHRKEAIRIKKINARDSRKQTATEKSKMEKEQKLLNEISARHINVQFEKRDEDSRTLTSLIDDLQPFHPVAKTSPVHLSPDGELIWPVLLLYPEYKESDCILQFNENSCFFDHFLLMFGRGERSAPWDIEHKYAAENLAIYFEENEGSKLISVDPKSTLGDTLSDYRYLVKAGLPGFIVLVKNSRFMEEFLSKYT